MKILVVNLIIVLLLIPGITACDKSTDTGIQANQDGLPSKLDFREQGIITPIKDQGNYGTCWAFSSIAVVEALIKKETGVTVDLSEQQLISCNANTRGIISTLEYIRDNGIVLEQRFPYRGSKDIPYTNTHQGDYYIAECYQTNVDKMPLKEKIVTIKRKMLEYGPVATSIDLYDDLRAYKSGIYEYDGVSKLSAGHIVVLVGWVDDQKVKNGGYWIVKNSAGSYWGENGYFRIPYGEVKIAEYYITYGVYSEQKN